LRRPERRRCDGLKRRKSHTKRVGAGVQSVEEQRLEQNRKTIRDRQDGSYAKQVGGNGLVKRGENTN
jgi:hypothetical protein